MEPTKELETPVQYIKGVGPQRAKHLENLGIFTVNDLMFYSPRDYDDREHIVPIKNLAINQKAIVHGQILSVGEYIPHRSHIKHIFKIIIGDDTGFVEAIWFNQPYLKDIFRKGLKVIFTGKLEYNKFHHLQISSPEYEIIEEEEDEDKLNVNFGRIVPIYPLTGTLTQKFLRKTIFLTLNKYAEILQDILPQDIIKKYSFQKISSALHEIHFPTSFENVKNARKRLAYQEFFLLELQLGKKRINTKQVKGISFDIPNSEILGFSQTLKFDLTNAQKKVLKEIFDDMKSDKPMLRLLQGDVGSGKTIVAAYTMLVCYLNKYQSAIMVPTEILAEQHYNTLSTLFNGAPIKISLLIGKVKKKEKDKIYGDIENGEINIVIGTQALIEDKLNFNKLGLVIIDEQHRFGVIQRSKLASKGLNPDVLVMTATPIPRTLAITVYGDMDVSIIDELPPGRIPPITRWSNESKRFVIYDFMRQHIKEGRQVYVVYPLVEESEKIDLKAAVKMAEHLSKDIFPELSVCLLHGKMKSKEKEEIMQKFKKNEISILVSTTVIEVGIDVPNASIMLIEHAERFGLAQLHQLRGRIGRGVYKSFCILLTGDKIGEDGVNRLKIFTQTNDGFKIAEEDLNIRGPGEFMGTKQHGIPEFKFANLLRDGEILTSARKDAFEIIDKDSELNLPDHLRLKELVEFGVKNISA